MLFEARSWPDVVRESQEVVELALNALLRAHGVDVPRMHDVSEILLAERARLPAALHKHLDSLARISHDLRRDRELAFEGSEDLTPTTFYTEADATAARNGARSTVELAAPHIPRPQ